MKQNTGMSLSGSDSWKECGLLCLTQLNKHFFGTPSIEPVFTVKEKITVPVHKYISIS